MPDDKVKQRIDINHEAFRKAQAAHGNCEYERWQIIE